MRRWFGPAAGLLAGAVLALTPVAALMFRFNNPDALLTLLLVAAAYVRHPRPGGGPARAGSSLAGAAVGFAFLTKMLQAFLVAARPSALVYAGRAPPGAVGRRIGQLRRGERRDDRRRRLVGGDRRAERRPPTVPTSAARSTNSFLELIFGYNGLGRITGNGPARAAAAGSGASRHRLRGSSTTEMGGQIAWLLAVAAAGPGRGLWAPCRGRPRTDRRRAALPALGRLG